MGVYTPHTQGAWEYRETLRTYIVKPVSNSVYVQRIAVVDKSIFAESQSNARLIAAAPDMLEALHKIENWLSASFIATPQDMAQSFEEMYWTARHAIAKAKGESAE